MDSKGIQEKFKALFAWTVSPLRGPADRLSARWEHSFLWPVLACRPVLFSFSTERLSIWFAPPRRSPGRLDVAALAARSPHLPLLALPGSSAGGRLCESGAGGRRRSAVGVSLPLRSLSSRCCGGATCVFFRVEVPPAAALFDLAFPLVRTGSRRVTVVGFLLRRSGARRCAAVL
jgi:hypothetical protein